MDQLQYIDESELVLQVKNGNEEALAELIRRHQQLVARVVVGMLGNTPEADDVGQETFIRFWNAVQNYRHEAKVSTFLTRIAINLSINELRKRNKRFEWESSLEGTEFRKMSIAYPNESKRIDENEHISKALAAIEPDHRAVVILRLVQGYSTNETAQILGIPIGTVLSRLSRALEKLRIVIKKLEEV